MSGLHSPAVRFGEHEDYSCVCGGKEFFSMCENLSAPPSRGMRAVFRILLTLLHWLAMGKSQFARPCELCYMTVRVKTF